VIVSAVSFTSTSWPRDELFAPYRVHLAVLLILDTGLRISEALNLRQAGVDCDNLILKVFGKGQKERFVPFSPELRKRLYRFEQFKKQEGHPQRFGVRRVAGHPMGEAQQLDLALPPAEEAWTAGVWLAPAAAHIRHQLP
jgi:integrase